MGGSGGLINKIGSVATFGLEKDITGQDAMARAAQGAANAQLSEARRQRMDIQRLTEAPTVAAMAQFDTALKAQERSLASQEKLLAQIDPTIMEASQQALALLRGEESKTLGPAKQQREMQRQKLLSSLREQLGPGAETSTAGIQALTRFDSETNSLMAGQQQQALQGLGQTFGTFSSYKPNIGQEASTFANLAQGRAGLRFNQAAAMTGANQQVYQSAGAPYAGAMASATAQNSMFNALLGAGAQVGAAALTGGASKMIPTTPTPPLNYPGGHP